MLTTDFLQQIVDNSSAKQPQNYDELIENIETLEKAARDFYGIYLSTKLKKEMQKYGERDTDIHIVSHAKSGTTLTQMLLYQLTTDGDMDFEHLYDVSPWIRWCVTRSLPIPELEGRRLLKSHEIYDVMSHIKKGEVIFLLRNMLDVLPSAYQQTKNYYNNQDDFEKFVDKSMKRWFEYNTPWLKNEKGLDILYVHYEDLVQDKANTIQKIADFTNIKLTDEMLQRSIERTSFEFMKIHETKFGDQPAKWKVYDKFIRSGKIGKGKQDFIEAQLAEYQKLADDFMREHEQTARYFEGE